MRALSFDLKGDFAFFKKNETNQPIYFSYKNIHKVALLGILGAIIGLGGYFSQKEKTFPDFYEKLKDLKVSITPVCPNGNFRKKNQKFNNSVGYASEEEGKNLIVEEEWLESPFWHIYILIDPEKEKSPDSLVQKICYFILEEKSFFIPYLGKNDHFAIIENPKIIEIFPEQSPTKIHSLFIEKDFDVIPEMRSDEDTFYNSEFLPIAIDEELNQYFLDRMVFSNMKIRKKENSFPLVYSVDNKNLYFF